MENTFGKPIIPANENERLQALYHYRLLDNLPAGYFTNLAHIIAQSFDTPIALVSIVDKEKVLFPGNVGMEDTSEVSRGISLCSLAVLDDEPTIFRDALKEPCLLSNPLVTGEFGLRFYAGAPILTKDGFALGTVCVVDKEPREFSAKEEAMLQSFADTAMEEIEMRLRMLEMNGIGV
jgi:GAF domain-containing protein